MATFAAIMVTAQAIRGLLANACPAATFAGAQFKLYQAPNFQGHPLIEFGVSVYLHRVSFNSVRRNRGPRSRIVDGEIKRYRPSTPLDLHFLITPWARSADKQLQLLGWAVRTLEETPVLPAGFLNKFAGNDTEVVFADEEGVELIGESPAAQDYVNIWEVAKANQQPSLCYVARQVLIDSEIAIAPLRDVQTRRIETAEMIT